MRAFKATTATLTILALMVGIPAALVALGAYPTGVPSADQVWAALSTPDHTGRLFLGALAVVAWIGWLTFTIAVLVELPAAMRGRPARRLRGMGLQQKLAAVLLGAIFIGVAAPVLAPQMAHAEPATVGITQMHTLADVDQTNPNPSPTTAGQAGMEAAPQQAPTGPVHTVVAGESLWSIAETELGDGNRWREIAQLNYDRPQPGGHTLTGAHWIDPGWELILPAGPAQASTTPAETTHVVGVGESLWSIAEAELGDGNRWPAIADLNYGQPQPGGQALTDPDIIMPGWNLALPASAATQGAVVGQDSASGVAGESLVGESPAESSSAVETGSGPVAEGSSDVGESGEGGASVVTPEAAAPTVTTAPAPSAAAHAPAQKAHVAASDEVAAEEGGGWLDLRLAGTGAGIFVASGIVGVLAARRVRARRRREPGRRVPMPEPATAIEQAEHEMRAVANPRVAAQVDVALRELAATVVPDLRAARLTREGTLEVFLQTPAYLPEPWRDHGAVGGYWSRPIEDLEPGAGVDVAAPFPCLVTLGNDDEGAALLLNLEPIGVLDVDTANAREIITAIAIEMATCPWVDDLQITLIGGLSELAGTVDTGRIRYREHLADVVAELTARGDQISAALAQAGVESVAQARAAGVAADVWTPEILIIAAPPTPAELTALEQVARSIPQLGVAAVTGADTSSTWQLRDTDDEGVALLEPAGFRIHPQHLTEKDYQLAVELLRQPEEPTIDGPQWARGLDPSVSIDDLSITMPDRTPHHVAAAEVGGVDPTALPSPEPVAEPEFVLDPVEGNTVPAAGLVPEPADPSQRPITLAGDEVTGAQEESEPADDPTAHTQPAADVAPEPSEDPAPLTGATDDPVGEVHELRPPMIKVLGDIELTDTPGVKPEPYKSGPPLELIAFLHLHPGADYARVTQVLWPATEPTRATRNSVVSRARRWLGTLPNGAPHFPRIADSSDYHLEGVTSDWERFLELIGPDVTKTPTDDLMAALALVRGRPFKNARPGRYVWAEADMEEMIASIIDVAHHVATRALAAGDYPTARRAAAAGILADVADERCWRDALAADHASSVKAYADTVTLLGEHWDELGLEPDPETVELIHRLEARAVAAS